MNEQDERRPEATPGESKRVYASYGGSGSLLKVKLKPSHYEALQGVQKALRAVSGKSFSSTLLLRRAFENYVREVLSNRAVKAS